MKEIRYKIIEAENLIMNRRCEEAIELLDEVLEIDPDNEFALNDRGVALNELQRYREAIEQFRRVISLNPGNGNAIYNLIMNYFSLGDFQTARDYYEKYGERMSERDRTFIEGEIKKNLGQK